MVKAQTYLKAGKTKKLVILDVSMPHGSRAFSVGDTADSIARPVPMQVLGYNT